MGVGITVAEPALLRDQIAGLYGAYGSLFAEWLVHLLHGLGFGLVFAVVVAGMGLLRPMWLEAVGLAAPSLHFVTVSLILWHFVFGAVLGAVVPALDDW